MRTDWSKRTDPERFLNVKADGPHVPGPNADAIRLLVEGRDVTGWGGGGGHRPWPGLLLRTRVPCMR